MVDFISLIEYLENKKNVIRKTKDELYDLEDCDSINSASLNTGITNAIESLDFILEDLDKKIEYIRNLAYEEAEVLTAGW